MVLKGIDRLGDWNPQLLRELKGRLKGRNIAIAVGASVLGYLAMFLYGLNQFTRLSDPDYYVDSKEIFCKLPDTYLANQAKLSQLQEQYRLLQDQFFRYSSAEYYDLAKINQLKGSIENVKTQITNLQGIAPIYECPKDAIDIPLWWQYQHGQMFGWLSVIVLFVLLTVGTYMLIADLAGEEHRGTLNFIRVSPQSAQSILLGKVLGVPILLYIAAVLLIPLHLWLGLSAQIPLGEIFSFYAVLIAGCVFFYSAALLFGLMSSWLNGFQSWLGGGAVFLFLLIAFNRWTWITQNPLDWMKLFSPDVILPYLYNQTEHYSPDFIGYSTPIESLQWFHIPVGLTGLGIFSFVLLNYALWTGWIWQALKRRFQNPNTAVLSKRQSYWLVACVEILLLGFAVQEKQDIYISYSLVDNLWIIFCFNVALFLGLIAALSSHRQVLQDWARYRQQQGTIRKKWRIVQDLIWGEKSPAIVAIGINLAIATTPFWVWIALWNEPGFDKLKALLAVAFFICITLICSTLGQLMLMMKTSKRALWATGTIGAVLSLPPIMLLVLGIETHDNPIPWLFSSFPWAGIEYAATSMMAFAILSEFLLWGLLTFQLTRQLRKAGESATQALLAGHSSSRR